MIRYCIIWDIDGVLANNFHRLFLIQRDPPDYDAYHALMPEDHPIKYAIEICNAMSDLGNYNALCTARKEESRDGTVLWLRRHSVMFNLVLMRANDDSRPACDLKRGHVHLLRNRGFTIKFAVEDNPETVQMYRDLGIPCLAADPKGWTGGNNQ